TPTSPGSSLEISVTGQEGMTVAVPGKGPATSFAVTSPAAGPSSLDVVVAEGGAVSGRLLVEATLVEPDGTRQTAIALWGRPTPEPPATERHPGSRVVTAPDGRQVLEIPSGRP